MSENHARVSRCIIFEIKKIVDSSSWVLKVYVVLKALKFCLTSVVNRCLSTGLAYWTLGTVEQLLPASVGHIVLIHNWLCGGASNLLLSCQPTVFHSVSLPFRVWYMGRTWWCSWIQWVHDLHLSCHNHNCYFEYTYGYSILELLVKVSPLGSGQIKPVTF